MGIEKEEIQEAVQQEQEHFNQTFEQKALDMKFQILNDRVVFLRYRLNFLEALLRENGIDPVEEAIKKEEEEKKPSRSKKK